MYIVFVPHGLPHCKSGAGPEAKSGAGSTQQTSGGSGENRSLLVVKAALSIEYVLNATAATARAIRRKCARAEWRRGREERLHAYPMSASRYTQIKHGRKSG